MKKALYITVAFAAFASLAASAESQWSWSEYQFDRDQRMGAIVFDVDNDGLNDLIYLNDGGVRIYLNDSENPGQSFTKSQDTGIEWIKFAKMCAFDYDNDGYADLVISGKHNDDHLTYLYHNDAATQPGHFSYVETNLPVVKTDDNGNESFVYKMFAAGDYDRDGYVDLAVCGVNDGRLNRLYRNNGGDGTFTEVTTFPTESGRMHPMSGSITMADMDNDGWLDIIVDGWADEAPVGSSGAGSNTRVYKNVNGESFVDVSPAEDKFRSARGANHQINDFNCDGYLDYLTVGYNDYNDGAGYGGWFNAIFYGTGDESVIKGVGELHLELPWSDTFGIHVRDFDGDGNLDILYDGKEDNYIFYGTVDDSDNMKFSKASAQFAARGGNIRDSRFGVGDLTGNNMSDCFKTGYEWCADDLAAFYGISGGWNFAGFAFINQAGGPEVIDVPTDVKAVEADGKICITWTDVADKTYAYNVVALCGDKVLANIPVSVTDNGAHVSVSEGREACIRPGVQAYELPLPEGNYKVGVQAVSLYTEAGSDIAWAETSSIEDIAVETEGPAKFFDIMGRTVSESFRGVCVKVQNGKATKMILK